MKLVYTLDKLPEIADQILSTVTNKTLLFYGDMGVGKTTLIKELAKKIGVTDTMTSPTFSIINEYEIRNDKLFHFDFYRLKNENEALDIGIEDYFESEHWKLIEWPEKIQNLLPFPNTKIELTKNFNNSRTLNMKMLVN